MGWSASVNDSKSIKALAAAPIPPQPPNAGEDRSISEKDDGGQVNEDRQIDRSSSCRSYTPQAPARNVTATKDDGGQVNEDRQIDRSSSCRSYTPHHCSLRGSSNSKTRALLSGASL